MILLLQAYSTTILPPKTEGTGQSLSLWNGRHDRMLPEPFNPTENKLKDNEGFFCSYFLSYPSSHNQETTP